MTQTLLAQPLTAAAFTPFGDVLDANGAPDKLINADLCGRYHDRATLDFADGRAGISIFDAVPRSLPYAFDLVERHPEGSQAFVPMHQNPWLVIVAPDAGGRPGDPLAFLVGPGQAINFHKGTWHGVLTPLHAPGLFAVIDRIGAGTNLQEVRYPAPWRVIA
ncbi:ureidoglycolate lyase [Loktanella sp. TSTF-M6]|uniref:Ureidoglycolate lyase n=1 Tax=Loktanella gaetbuli TaxID=2881335 RepID=A0ABS8BYJ9_9RHOB|nr:ureidoglycolate lyase [Loktanella gaetbuli]MCB5200813.1 ureidoglycolate lyase [Loktanella gaetbuli]